MDQVAQTLLADKYREKYRQLGLIPTTAEAAIRPWQGPIVPTGSGRDPEPRWASPIEKYRTEEVQ